KGSHVGVSRTSPDLPVRYSWLRRPAGNRITRLERIDCSLRDRAVVPAGRNLPTFKHMRSGGAVPADPQRAEADRVRGHAGIPSPPDQPLHRQGPLALDMKMTIDAGGDARAFPTLDPRAGLPVRVEGGIVPKDE